MNKNCRIFTKFSTSITPCKKRNSKKSFSYNRMHLLFNDTTHNSLRWIYRSAKIMWTKKPSWVYSSSLLTKLGVGTINLAQGNKEIKSITFRSYLRWPISSQWEKPLPNLWPTTWYLPIRPLRYCIMYINYGQSEKRLLTAVDQLSAYDYGSA